MTLPPSNSHRPVVIYGATGFTGGLVTCALIARGLPVVVAGRDRSRLAALASDLGLPVTAIRPAPLHDRRALTEAFAGAAVVINCAGPFVKLGEPVVAAAIAAGAHYLDPATEQPFVRDIYERYESAARRAGVTVVCALGVEGGLADWLAALVARDFDCDYPDGTISPDPADQIGGLDQLSVAYAVAGLRPSRASQLALLDRVGAPGFVWHIDRWEELPPAAASRIVAFPAPFGQQSAVSFPGAEVITVPRHVRARQVSSYLAVATASPFAALATRVAALVAPALPLLARSPLAAHAHARIPVAPEGPTAEQRDAARFAVSVVGERFFERSRMTATGSDPYGVTAEMLAGAAATLGRDGGPRSGVLAPAQAFDPDAALADLAGLGLEIDR